MTSINTWSGTTIDYANPQSDHIDIIDIATALSRECRYAGHCRHFYSVAQHSVLVSRLVPPEFALEGLLHDATEAYLKNLPSPLKALLPDYSEVEGRFDTVIRKRFGLPAIPSLAIKAADLVLLATERRDIIPDDGVDWPIVAGIEPMPRQIWPLAPEIAKEQFLDRYQSLTGEALDHKRRLERVR